MIHAIGAVVLNRTFELLSPLSITRFQKSLSSIYYHPERGGGEEKRERYGERKMQRKRERERERKVSSEVDVVLPNGVKAFGAHSLSHTHAISLSLSLSHAISLSL